MPNEKDCFSILQSREITLKSVRSDAAWKLIKIILKNIYQKLRNRFQRQILLVKDESKYLFLDVINISVILFNLSYRGNSNVTLVVVCGSST